MYDVQPAKVYKLKHLNKVEAVSSDNSGCTFVLVCDLFCHNLPKKPKLLESKTVSYTGNFSM